LAPFTTNTTADRQPACYKTEPPILPSLLSLLLVVELLLTANMNAADLTEAQLDGFSVIERTCSVFSLLGCIFIISTFLGSKAFHKPINRLVFYASFGNLMTNVATLMARSYVAQVNSAGCQFQAFLIQM
jgi:hypothetical protein